MTERLLVGPLDRPASDQDIRDLAGVLVDAVSSGAAVSFLAPLSFEAAEAWWRTALAAAPARTIVLVARDQDGIVGTVQVQPAWAPNQPHRGEVVKLLVHRRARRLGLGNRLMEALETAARAGGFSLLTLDTKAGDTAEWLYRRRGWTALGTIPGYALDPSGTPHGATFFYKHLAGGDGT